MPKTSYKDYLARVTGVSIPIFGIQWNPPELESKKARRLIAFLEDRRILFNPYSWEMPDECIASCEKIRDFITKELGDLDPDTELGQRLIVLRVACRDFADALRESGVDTHARKHFGSPHVRHVIEETLRHLRSVFGQQTFWIMMTYGLTVEPDLASTFPSELTGRP